MVNFEIGLVVNEIVLLVLGIEVNFKVGGYEVLALILPLLSYGPLFVFQPVLLFGCLDHVAVFQVALVGTAPRVGRCHGSLEPGGEVVQLQAEVTQAIHVLPLLRVGILFVNQYRSGLVDLAALVELVWKKLGDVDRSVPVAVDSVEHPLLLALAAGTFLVDLAIALAYFFGDPAAFVEADLTLEFGVLEHPRLLCTTHINVHGAHNEIVQTQSRRLDLVSLLSVRHVDITVVLLGEVYALAVEFGVSFLVGPVHIIGLLTSAISSCDRRMVRNLLGQELEVICN